MRFIRYAWFPILCALITLISLYDTFLIVLYRDEISSMEENPLGILLLNTANGDVGIFVRAKLAGTLIVVTILTCMRRCQSRRTLPVTTSIAVLQTALFTYLTFV